MDNLYFATGYKGGLIIRADSDDDAWKQASLVYGEDGRPGFPKIDFDIIGQLALEQNRAVDAEEPTPGNSFDEKLVAGPAIAKALEGTDIVGRMMSGDETQRVTKMLVDVATKAVEEYRKTKTVGRKVGHTTDSKPS